MEKELAQAEASHMKEVRHSKTHKTNLRYLMSFNTSWCRAICLRMFEGPELLAKGRSLFHHRHQSPKAKKEDKVHTQRLSHIDFSHEPKVKIQPGPTLKRIH